MKFALFALSLCFAAEPSFSTSFIWNSPTSAPIESALNYAYQINNNGLIAGDKQGHAALLDASAPFSVIDLGVPHSISSAVAISESGSVAGLFYDAGQSKPFFWSSVTGYVEISQPGWQLVLVSGVNDGNQAVGQGFFGGNGTAYAWSPSTGVQALGQPNGTFVALAINNSGMVACHDNPPPYTNISAAICSTVSTSTHTPVPFQLPAPTPSTAVAINELGWVVGRAGPSGYVYVPGVGVTILPNFMPIAVNNVGQIAGQYAGKNAIWTSSAGFQELIAPQTAEFVYLTDINDAGQIIGNAIDTPEPATFGLAAAALGALAWRRKRACISQLK